MTSVGQISHYALQCCDFFFLDNLHINGQGKSLAPRSHSFLGGKKKKNQCIQSDYFVKFLVYFMYIIHKYVYIY